MLLLIVVFKVLLFSLKVIGHEERKPSVILISFDGFRWNYLDNVETKTLSSLAKNGVKASVLNNFVTKTFPNHYSIVTGRYEENHGIINNRMWDPVYKEFFTMKTVDPKWYNASEPLWITNQKAGDRRLSAVINWVGGSVPYHGQKASFSPPYNSKLPFKEIVDIVLQQLTKDPPVNFVAMYFNEPDAVGHVFGPNSKEVVDAILKLDNVTGYLVDKLKKVDLFDKVNIILTSDHGMTEISPEKVIFLDDYISRDKYELIDSGVNSFIIPHEGETENVYKNLSNIPHMTAYHKEDIPSQWHYKNNRRVTPIFLACDLGYRIFQNISFVDSEKGAHGYNNSLKDMHPFFIAHGPAFKKNYNMSEFSIVHIYPLICHLLGVTPAENDGDLTAVLQMLSDINGSSFELLIFAMIISGLVLMFMVYCLIRNCRKSSRVHYDVLDLENILLS